MYEELKAERSKIMKESTELQKKLRKMENDPNSDFHKISRKHRLLQGGDVPNYSIKRDGKFSELKAKKPEIEKAYYKVIGEMNNLKSDIKQKRKKLQDINATIRDQI